MNKKTKAISIFLAAIMFISIIAVFSEIFTLEPAAVKAEKPAVNTGDEQAACDISNITGVKTEVLLAERSKGKSWNDILEELRQGSYEKGSSSEQRDNTLLQAGIGENEISRLKEDGFKDEEIQEARMLVERVAFQLQEITAGNMGMDTSLIIYSSDDNLNDETGKYNAIASKFNLISCLNIILRLREDLGSLEKALDEYLLCLQLDLDLTLYLADKEEYLSLKEEKSSIIAINEIVTILKIEEKMLESLNKRNQADEGSVTTEEALSGDISNKLTNSLNNEVSIPAADMSQLADILPENPADAIKKEIEILDPMRNINGGRN